MPYKRSVHRLYMKEKYRSDPIHRMKQKARALAYKEIRMGRVQKKPCRICGSSKDVKMHHEDYSKPLEIDWLCDGCHRSLHEEKKAQVAGP